MNSEKRSEQLQDELEEMRFSRWRRRSLDKIAKIDRTLREGSLGKPPVREEAKLANREKLLQVHEALQGVQEEEPERKPVWRSRSLRVVVPAMAVVVLAIGLMLFFFVGRVDKSPRAVFVGTLRVEGDSARVIDADGGESVVERIGRVAAHDTILTQAEGRATLELDQGSTVRMDNQTSVEIDKADGQSLETTQLDGEAYYMVEGRLICEIPDTQMVITAENADLDVESNLAGAKISKAMAIQGEFRVSVEGGAASVSEGEEALVVAADGTADLTVRGIELATLDVAWLEWNLAQDLKEGAVTSPLEDILLLVQPQPIEQPPPVEAPGPPVIPEPKPVSSVVITEYDLADSTVVLHWDVSGSPRHTATSILRSETVPQPIYPAQDYQLIGGTTPGAFTDTGADRGHAYYYRVALVDGTAVVNYSNVVQVVVPPIEELSVQLAGGEVDSAVSLRWHLAGEGQFDGYVICRSTSNPIPGVPPGPGDLEIYMVSNAAEGSFLDTDVVPGESYHYRVGVTLGTEVLVYSNDLTVSTSGAQTNRDDY